MNWLWKYLILETALLKCLLLPIDIFEIQKKNISVDENNFFLSNECDTKLHKLEYSTSMRRLNDYDFNLLKEDAYKDVSDDLFKLEYKISKVEDEIKSLDQQIIMNKEIHDFNMVEELEHRKRLAEEDYQTLVALYNEKSFSAKLSDKILNLLGKKIKDEVFKFRKTMDSFSEVVISFLPEKLTRVFELKKSLDKLESINKNVDELISMNIPYGENYDKYNQLSKYIIKANSIHSELSNFRKK